MFSLSRSASILSLFLLAAATHAAGRGENGAQAAANPPEPSVAVPASVLVEAPGPYYGRQVTVFGAVDELLSEGAFTIDQDPRAHTAKELLVLARQLRGGVELNAYLTVVGTVVRFSPEGLTEFRLLEPPQLPAHVAAKYENAPVVLATSVITAALDDLCATAATPTTAGEQTYDRIMKGVGSAFEKLRKDDRVRARAAHAEFLKEAFAAAESYWTERGREDASRWSREARALAEDIEHAIREDRTRRLARTIQQLEHRCQACHAEYRERLEDGAYRIKRLSDSGAGDGRWRPGSGGPGHSALSASTGSMRMAPRAGT
jgi:hypothetical protein